VPDRLTWVLKAAFRSLAGWITGSSVKPYHESGHMAPELFPDFLDQGGRVLDHIVKGTRGDHLVRGPALYSITATSSG
jgi:hypothetical protein